MSIIQINHDHLAHTLTVVAKRTVVSIDVEVRDENGEIVAEQPIPATYKVAVGQFPVTIAIPETGLFGMSDEL